MALADRTATEVAALVASRQVSAREVALAASPSAIEARAAQ